MDFQEKLQELRTQAKLSQEELAEMLHLSRQSVTKWENGQSFPDIQNLIKLSEIFKITIDRLVKDSGGCTVQMPGRPVPKQDLKLFLVQAKKSTYSAGAPMVSPCKPNSKDYRFTQGDYTYMDTYFGSERFAGEEAVWEKGIPLYAMNYYGQVLSETFDIHFLKEALSLVSPAMPFRGPELYQKGDYTYHCRVHGHFDCFWGEETIFCSQKTVYRCMFHGGGLI